MKTAKPKLTIMQRVTPTMLEDLRSRTTTIRRTAEMLKTHPNHLSRVLAENGFKLPEGAVQGPRKAASRVFQDRQNTRETLARQVYAGQLTLAEACVKADCSERTMFRHLAKLAKS